MTHVAVQKNTRDVEGIAIENKGMYTSLKGQYRHDQSRLSTGHVIGVLI